MEILNVALPVLKLGMVDRGRMPPNLDFYFAEFHNSTISRKLLFRCEKNGHWEQMLEIDGTHVHNLQTTLRESGFYPHGELDGIFGYRTRSAVRLYQEYVRSVEGRTNMGAPDGIVGDLTHAQLKRWIATGQKADWLGTTSTNPTPEFRYWMEVLRLYRERNLRQPVGRDIAATIASRIPTDTVKPLDWELNSDEIHLIGIRRREWVSTETRHNDDIFILLVSGLVFKFYGSTDPSQTVAKRRDEPFITRGQHRYRFGWHKKDDPDRVYRAFCPSGMGVFVSRDINDDDSLTDRDSTGGLSTNVTINIHWSGRGRKTWSAGCQVISGARYVNHGNQDIDCGDYAADSYGDLTVRTRGSYNVLLDLITVFASSISVRNGSQVFYTLISEKDMDLDVRDDQTLASAALQVVSELSDIDISRFGQLVSVNAIVDRLISNA